MWSWIPAGSDAAWVRRALRDEPRAFEVLVLRYQKKAHALARAAGVGEAGADDVVQDSFLKAFESLPDLRSPESFGGWFLAIVRNTARRSLRDARSRSRVPLPEELEAVESGTVERDDLREAVWRKIAGMPEGIREAIYLYYHEGESIREVARALGISRAAALKRLERGRDLLREKLWREVEAQMRGRAPSAGEWTRRGRQLSILLLGAVGASWAGSVAGAAGAAGAGNGLGQGLGQGLGHEAARHLWRKAALGGIDMAGKKTAAAAAIVLCTVIGGILLVAVRHGREAVREPAAEVAERAGAKRAAAGAEGASAPATAGRESAEASRVSAETAAAGTPSILGKVADREGRGIEGARLLALGAERWNAVVARSRPHGPMGYGDPRTMQELLRGARAEGDKFPHAVSGADGAFHFDDLEAGAYRILAGRDGYLPATDALAIVSAGRPSRCDIVLDGAASVAGRVRDESGRPVAGAAVTSRPSDDRRLGQGERKSKVVEEVLRGGFLLGPWGEGATGADGSFRLESLEVVPQDLQVRKPGFARALVLDVPPGKKDLEVVLARGLSIRGRVLGPDRKPAAGLAVTLGERSAGRIPPPAVGQPMDQEYAGESDPDEDHAATTASTGGDGTFEFTGLLPGGYTVGVRHPGLTPLEVDLRLEDAPANLGDLLLAVALAIKGRISDQAGMAVDGARVWVEDAPRTGVAEWGGRFFHPEVLAEARSGPQGLFTLEGLPAGVFTVRASSRDHLPARATGVASGAEGVAISLGKGRTVRGTVVDGPSGAPVAGAEVLLVSGLNALPVPEKRDETGPDGAFEIHGVPVDGEQKELRVSHPAYGGARDFPASDSPSGSSRGLARLASDDRLTIRLYPPDRIAGRVVDAEGKPVPGARVSLEGMGIEWLVREMGKAPSVELTDPEGAFAIDVPRSFRNGTEVHLAARHALGSGRSTLKGTEAIGWPEAEIVLVAGSELRGRVLDAAGAAVTGAVVRAAPAGPRQGSSAVASTGASDARGSYRLGGLVPGSYQVEVRAAGFAVRRIPDLEMGDGPREEDFTLEPGWSLEGKVTDGDGRPVAGAEVLALEPKPEDVDEDGRVAMARAARRSGAGGILSARTGSEGSYTLSHLEGRELTLVARAPGYGPSELTRVKPGQARADLVLVRLSTVTGRAVELDSGKPVPLFSVHLSTRGHGRGTAYNELLPRQFDDPAGSFVVEGMPAGEWTLVVVAKGYAGWAQDISVAAGQETRVEAVLDPGKTLRGVVTDDAGAPLSGVTITVWGKLSQRASIPGVQEWTAEDGSFAVGGLPSGSHSLSVYHPDYFWEGQDRLRVQVGDADPDLVRIALRRGGRLEGKIDGIDPAGTFWTSLMLTRVLEEKEGDPAKPPKDPSEIHFDRDGRIHSQSIPPGVYAVRLHERVQKPDAPRKGGVIYNEDLEDRYADLGQVEIRAGEVTEWSAKLPGERPAE